MSSWSANLNCNMPSHSWYFVARLSEGSKQATQMAQCNATFLSRRKALRRASLSVVTDGRQRSLSWLLGGFSLTLKPLGTPAALLPNIFSHRIAFQCTAFCFQIFEWGCVAHCFLSWLFLMKYLPAYLVYYSLFLVLIVSDKIASYITWCVCGKVPLWRMWPALFPSCSRCLWSLVRQSGFLFVRWHAWTHSDHPW